MQGAPVNNIIKVLSVMTVILDSASVNSDNTRAMHYSSMKMAVENSISMDSQHLDQLQSINTDQPRPDQDRILQSQQMRVNYRMSTLNIFLQYFPWRHLSMNFTRHFVNNLAADWI